MPLKVSDGIGAYIDDFKKSDAPQFKGKSNKERRDQAIAAYLSAKKGPKNEAMSPGEKAAHDRAIAAFKKRGGKVQKLKPGYAQGYHGKDDPGKGVAGMLKRPDTDKFGTKKKIKSMSPLKMSKEAADYPHMMYDPKTGKGVKANTYEKHLSLKKKGYDHRKRRMGGTTQCRYGC